LEFFRKFPGVADELAFFTSNTHPPLPRLAPPPIKLRTNCGKEPPSPCARRPARLPVRRRSRVLLKAVFPPRNLPA
jgi:hypothetical protein